MAVDSKIIEVFFHDLITCLQVAKLYTVNHVRYTKYLDKAFASLEAVLKDEKEIIMGIVGDELAYEREIFFALSQQVKPVIMFFKERGMERIAFFNGATKDELNKFIAFIASPKDEAKMDMAKYLVNNGVKNIEVGKILTSKAGDGGLAGIGELHHLSLYANYSEQAEQVMNSMVDGKTVDSLNLRFLLNTVMEGLATQHREMLTLANIKRYDLSTYLHSLNVAILSMHFSSRLGFAKDDVLDIGIAAMLHDVGKLYISRKIIKKTAKLTDEEFENIKSHVVLGAEILFSYIDSVGPLPLVIAFEHHLRFNLTGYPKLHFPHKPHTASSIVTICDVYDALYQRRNYKNDYPPDMIYSIMAKDRGTYFDPDLLDEFFRVMGVWPIGTLVSLTGGKIAVVREENYDDVSAPKVEVIMPPEARELIDLKNTKETIKIEKFINPWSEGKDLLPLLHKELA